MKNKNKLERFLSRIDISTDVKLEIESYFESKSKNIKWLSEWKEDIQENIVERYRIKFNKEIEELVIHFVNNKPTRHGDSKSDSVKNSDQILKIITAKNTAISAAFGLIPPPFSYFSVIPELVIVLNNQLKMLSDIGYSVGGSDNVNSDSVFGLFVSNISKAGKKFVLEDGGNYVVSRINKDVTPQICHYISNTLLSQLSQSLVSKFVPGLGSVFFATWVRYKTVSMGKRAVEVFSKKIIFQPLGEHWDQHFLPDTKNQYSEEDKITETIKLLINLMNLDGVKHKREKSHILDLITNSTISQSVKDELLNSFLLKNELYVNYEILNSLDHKSVLILDLLSFANIDGEISTIEMKFIETVAQKLNKTSVLELLKVQ